MILHFHFTIQRTHVWFLRKAHWRSSSMITRITHAVLKAISHLPNSNKHIGLNVQFDTIMHKHTQLDNTKKSFSICVLWRKNDHAPLEAQTKWYIFLYAAHGCHWIHIQRTTKCIVYLKKQKPIQSIVVALEKRNNQHSYIGDVRNAKFAVCDLVFQYCNGSPQDHL